MLYQGAEPHSRVARGDCGTENVIVCGIQRFFRRNRTDNQVKTEVSFMVTQQQTNV